MFDAEVPASVWQGSFNPIGTCPAYQVRREIAAAVAEKQRKDRLQTAELIAHGTPTVHIRSGIDGGMHPVFLAKFKTALVREVGNRAGTVVEARTLVASDVDARSASPSREQAVAASNSQASGPASISTGSGNFFSRLLRGSEEKKPESAAKLAAAPAPKAAPARPTSIAAAKPKPNVEKKREALAQLPRAQPRPEAGLSNRKWPLRLEPWLWYPVHSQLSRSVSC